MKDIQTIDINNIKVILTLLQTKPVLSIQLAHTYFFFI